MNEANRHALASLRPERYQRPGWPRQDPEAIRVAETAIAYGWYREIDRATVSITAPVNWADPGASAPARAALHSWEAIDALLAAHSLTGEPRFLAPAVAFAEDWLQAGQEHDPGDVATTGARAFRLAYLITAAAEAESAEATVGRLSAAASAHCIALEPVLADGSAETDAVAGLRALAIRAAPVLAEADVLVEQTATAVLDHVRNVFDEDGVHRSGWPGEHHRVLGILSSLAASGLMDDPVFDELRAQAEDALAWFVMPDGTLANFGDTPQIAVSAAYDPQPSGVRFLPDIIVGRHYLSAATAGRFGRQPAARGASFEASGFWIAKHAWPGTPEDRCTYGYVAMRTGGTESVVTRDDSMSLVWYDAGRHLLIEPGPPLGDPAADGVGPRAASLTMRSAHNTVDAGSGRFVGARGEVERWGSFAETAYYVDARAGANDASHTRHLLYAPGRWLVVVDDVHTDGAAPVRQWFHAADDLGILPTDARFTLLDAHRPLLWATPLLPAAPLSPLRGRDEPAPAGWWSPRLGTFMPNWAFGWEADGAQVRLATVLSLEGPIHPSPEDGPWLGWTTGSRKVRFALTEKGIVDIDQRDEAGSEVA